MSYGRRPFLFYMQKWHAFNGFWTRTPKSVNQSEIMIWINSPAVHNALNCLVLSSSSSYTWFLFGDNFLHRAQPTMHIHRTNAHMTVCGWNGLCGGNDDKKAVGFVLLFCMNKQVRQWRKTIANLSKCSTFCLRAICIFLVLFCFKPKIIVFHTTHRMRMTKKVISILMCKFCILDDSVRCTSTQ